MDIETYKRRRALISQEAPTYRNLCTRCLQPEFGCYCQHVQGFDPKIKFVILIHSLEFKRRIATGRMSHLCLENSELICGQDYSSHQRVNQLIEDPKYQPVVLYPGRTSLNLTEASCDEKQNYFVSDKTPLIFVIDGTWATARKTMHLSQNLKSLPRVCFTPTRKSQFRVRKQPAEECYSTIEAIHHFIELMGPREEFDPAEKYQDRLLFVFNKMVERQLEFIDEALKKPRASTYRHPLKRPDQRSK